MTPLKRYIKKISHPLEVVFRYRDLQFHVGDIYTDIKFANGDV